MEGYKRGSHTVWDCKYHVVWTTKYRFAVLDGDVGDRCRELLRETARAHETIIHAGAINRDHVHMLVSIPPSLSVARAVQYLKGRSSHKLLNEFGLLRKRYWGQHLKTEADRQRRITDSFLKAVEQLGSDKMPVRVGGIYTLERI